MLKRFSSSYSRLSDLRRNAFDYGCSRANEQGSPNADDDFLPPEVAAMHQLSLSLPSNALKCATGVASTCGKIFSPLCNYVESALSRDIEKLVSAIHEADPEFAADSEDEDEDIYVIPFPSSDEPLRLPTDESSEPCEENLGNAPVPLGSGGIHESEPPAPQEKPIPRIVVTPASSQQCREMSSCVPVQDTSFGSRLTVPSHTALNTCHPPMLPTPYPHTPLYSAVHTWTYRHGHWCAIVPCLEEQERREIFSRPINLRRRAMRKRAGSREHSVSRQNLFARSKRDS